MYSGQVFIYIQDRSLYFGTYNLIFRGIPSYFGAYPHISGHILIFRDMSSYFGACPHNSGRALIFRDMSSYFGTCPHISVLIFTDKPSYFGPGPYNLGTECTFPAALTGPPRSSPANQRGSPTSSPSARRSQTVARRRGPSRIGRAAGVLPSKRLPSARRPRRPPVQRPIA